MDDLTSQSASRLVELIRARSVSPVEIVQAYLRRIEQLNPTLNAIVTIDSEAISKARHAEAAIMRGDLNGSLPGLPLTVKDTIETAQLRSTSGSAMRAQFVPERDATAVSRLRAAGAIILGKTNAAEMAMDYTADNPVFGRTNNPHDLQRTPGGSSGGEAAAISACLSPCGLGSDLAGSIRIPAHFCGIAGLKPCTNRIPGDGQWPPNIGPYGLGSAIGPMARRAEDLQLLFHVLTGKPQSSEKTFPQKLREVMRGQSVAWYSEDGISPVTKETTQAVQNAARALAEAGLAVEHRRPPGIERGYDLWLKLFSRASVVQLREVYAGHEEEAGGFVRWRLATADEAPTDSLDDYIRHWMERDRLRGQLIEWMELRPLLLAPVGATGALEHDSHKVTVAEQTFGAFRAFSYSQTFNVFDLPAVSIPAGRSAEGLPIGVQIVGRPFAEETVLAAATLIEEALGGWQFPVMARVEP
jgi:amidase